MQKASGLALSVCSLWSHPPLPKGEVLAVHTTFTVSPEALPLTDSLRSEGDVAYATVGGQAGALASERASTVKIKASVSLFIKTKNFDGIVMHLLFILLKFTLDFYWFNVVDAASFCNSPIFFSYSNSRSLGRMRSSAAAGSATRRRLWWKIAFSSVFRARRPLPAVRASSACLRV